jgi:hypothetical protein
MEIIHPDLVAGRTVMARDERDNPIGPAQIVAATSGTVTLRMAGAEATLPAEALLAYHPQVGLRLITSSLGPIVLARLAAGQAAPVEEL